MSFLNTNNLIVNTSPSYEEMRQRILARCDGWAGNYNHPTLLSLLGQLVQNKIMHSTSMNTFGNSGVTAGHPAQANPSRHQATITRLDMQPDNTKPTGKGQINWFGGNSGKSASSRNITVYDQKGNPLHLSERDCKASGGEGDVYTIPLAGKAGRLVKIYHEDLLRNPVKRAEIEKRIDDMLAMEHGMTQASFAWPRMRVFNGSKQLIGFAMNQCDGVSLQAINGGIKNIQKHFPRWTRYHLALTARDFLTKVQYLASKRIYINDFNPANFLVDKDCSVSFIDCDSYQIPGKNGSVDITRTYFSSHVAPEFLECPKLLEKARDIHSVEFGAAIIVFNILMCGLHPYSYHDPSEQSACGTPEENLKRGRCPLGMGAGCSFPKGNWYNLWSYLTYDLKKSLIQTFREGHGNPFRRTSLSELWANLNELVCVVGKNTGYASLNPSVPKPHTYKGTNLAIMNVQQNRMGKQIQLRQRA